MRETTVSHDEYFSRQIELWGEATQESLSCKRIAIIGAGGLGCSLAMALGSSGIGEIDIVDFDTVSIHNIHRQIAFTTQDEGRSKSAVVAELMQSKNPFVKATAYDMDFETFAKLKNSYDLILDATDNLPVRAEIDRYARELDTPWIYASVEEFHGQVCFFDRADFGVMNVSDHKPAGIAAPIVMHIGSLQANIALRYLAGLPIDRDKLYYLYHNSNGELITQKLGMPLE